MAVLRRGGPSVSRMTCPPDWPRSMLGLAGRFWHSDRQGRENMAERRQHLAKSMVARIPASPVRCEILYVQRGHSPAGLEFAAHAHPFWQLEIALAGGFRCRTRAGDLALAAGDGLLIPAQ